MKQIEQKLVSRPDACSNIRWNKFITLEEVLKRANVEPITPHLTYPLTAQWPIRPKCISSSSLCQLLHVWLHSTCSTPVCVFHFQQLIATLSLVDQPFFYLWASKSTPFLSIHRICPTHFHLLNLTSVLIVFNFVFARIP